MKAEKLNVKSSHSFMSFTHVKIKLQLNFLATPTSRKTHLNTDKKEMPHQFHYTKEKDAKKKKTLFNKRFESYDQ